MYQVLQTWAASPEELHSLDICEQSRTLSKKTDLFFSPRRWWENGGKQLLHITTHCIFNNFFFGAREYKRCSCFPFRWPISHSIFLSWKELIPGCILVHELLVIFFLSELLNISSVFISFCQVIIFWYNNKLFVSVLYFEKHHDTDICITLTKKQFLQITV